MSVEITEKFLSDAAGWEAMKRARGFLTQAQVVSSFWSPPLLRGVVRVGEIFFRASLVIKDADDLENFCTCREARESGIICAHVVAVGLHWLKSQKIEAVTLPAPSAAAPVKSLARKVSALSRDDAGTPAELCIIFPPNFDQALARGKVMLVFEARWEGGQGPLNALPKGRAYAFPPADNAIINHLEVLSNGETPALLQLELKDFVALLPLLVGNKNLTLGKSSAVMVTQAPLPLPLRATLEPNGEIVLALVGQPAGFVRVGDWVWHKQILQPLGLPAVAEKIFQSPVRIPRSQVPMFLSQHWPQLQVAGGVEANFQLSDFLLEPQAPRFQLFIQGDVPLALQFWKLARQKVQHVSLPHQLNFPLTIHAGKSTALQSP